MATVMRIIRAYYVGELKIRGFTLVIDVGSCSGPLYLIVVANSIFFDKIVELRPLASLRDGVSGLHFGFLASVFAIFLSLFAFRWIFKPVAILLILIGAARTTS